MTPWLCCAVVAMAALLASCSEPGSAEDQIKTTIEAMEEAADNAERREFMSYVHDDFRGKGGEMLKGDFERFMILQMNRHQKIHTQLFPITVELTQGREARATFRALVTGGRGWLPEQGQLYDIETWWLNEDDEWLLTMANWKPVAAAR